MSEESNAFGNITDKLLQRCWEACWARARRPVEGVLVPDEDARRIAERALRNVSLDYDEFPGEAEFTARALEETSRATRDFVAEKRRAQSDAQLHHDPDDRRYDRNLDLDRLKKHSPEKGFFDREWNALPALLRPMAIHTLSRKGIKGPDADEIFNDTLVELTKDRTKGAPLILEPSVFEEIVPLHTRIVGFRAIDWIRKRSAQKNRPNTGESFDALTGDPDRPAQFEDRSADPDQTTFEKIYAECREALTPSEWDLIFAVFVSQNTPIQDLIADPSFCKRHGIRPNSSPSTKRRELQVKTEEALIKIRKNYIF